MAAPAGLAAQTAAPAETASLPAMTRRYCLGCHSARVKTGGLSLEGLDAAAPARHPEVWEKVVRRLRARQMPPAGLPRPSEGTYAAVVKQLASALDSASAAQPDPGRTGTFRRLTRYEYQNAIRDVLGLELDTTALLPADESSHGFDNITSAGLSPTLLERYLNAAKTVSRLTIGIAGRAPGGETVRLPPDLTQETHLDGLPLGTRGGVSHRYQFAVDAEYEIQVRLARDRNEHVEGLHDRHEVELMLDGERLKTYEVVPPKTGNHISADQHLNVRLRVTAGPHVVSAAFLKKPTLLIESERQPYQAHFNMDRHPRIQPAVFSLTVNGPYAPSGPGESPSRKRLMVCRPASGMDTACAERILGPVMRRAYRRPVTRADFEAPLKIFRATAPEEGFDAGIEMALRGVLVSPEFLFRVEKDQPGGKAYRVTDLELASRLSFFLWSSVPDEELLTAAQRGQLRDSTVLAAQVRRMLRDPRAKALSENFAAQWLQLRSLAAVNPDMRLFPDFDDNLRRAMRRETELLFESIVTEDRSVVDLLGANYTFVNERLAKHYEIPHVYGSRFRRVELAPGSGRGGLLRHGSILTVTSYATRTSPVIRGKWVLENLLGTAPPPPPPAVPALKDDGGAADKLPMRARLAKHRESPACQGCHQLMDPAGFSLENYDAIGRWRTRDGNAELDVSGGLPDGSAFTGVDGLEKAVLSRPELFVSALTEKLLTYALGRGVEWFDAPAVRGVVERAGRDESRFSSIILGIIESSPFQMRRPQ
jgi:cytochrome c551/c552